MVIKTEITPAGNRRLAQWRVTWLFLSSSCYQILVLADSLVVRSPPLRQAQER